MSYLKKAFWGVLVGLMVLSCPAFAKEFRGKVLSIKADESFLAVQVLDASDKPGEAVVLRGSKDLKLNGFASLQEISVGDVVQVDAEEALIGGWALKALSKIEAQPKPEPVQAAPAQAEPVKTETPAPAAAKPTSQVSSSAGGAAMAMGGYVGD